MANIKLKVKENIDGNFFVDTTCIDCGTCRNLAPESFAEAEAYSYVYRQPLTTAEELAALQALVCCPTGSIGTVSPSRAKEVLADFPLRIDDDIYYCGFTSPKSYGASSYLIRHPDGNWLVDSPKYLPNLVRKFQEMGGIRYIFLTHSDDVGEASRYADTFGATRIIHQKEAWAQPDSEWIIKGTEPKKVHSNFLVIPTPGHTQGSCVLLYRDWALFTGDHLWWEPTLNRLEMPLHYYWDQQEQVRSSRKLLDYSFEWVLPGHGQKVHLSTNEMKAALEEAIQRRSILLAS